MQNSMTKDMTSGNPMKLLFQFSLPLFVGNIFQQLYNVVDSVVVGRYVGTDALAAVGNAGMLTFFIFSILTGISAGVAIVLSQYFGAKDEKRVQQTFVSITYIVTIVAVITGIFGYITCPFWFQVLNTPPENIPAAVDYMRISCIGILGIAAYNGISFVLKSLGDSMTPLIALIIASVLNVVLDLVFVINFGMGVKGVAIATVIAQSFSAIVCIIYAFIKIKILRVPLKEFRPNKEITKQCMKMGIPVAIQNIFVACSGMAIQSVTNTYGTETMAAATIANKVEQMIIQPGVSIGVAISTYTGQNMGANNIERVKKGFAAATKLIVGFSLLLLPIVFFGAGPIVKLFTSPETQNYAQVVQYGMDAIKVPCFFYSFLGILFVTRNLLSGAGDVKVAMMMGFSEVVCRVIFANVLSYQFGRYGLWWVTGLAWFFTAMVGLIRYKSGKWKSKSIIS